VKTNSNKGLIFNIQYYSIHDGPGIRTTVFFKGCPLRCSWCQNPESQHTKNEILYDNEQCSGCETCVSICPQHAITVTEYGVKTDRSLCLACGECVYKCPQEARKLVGKLMTADEVFEEVHKDAIFYQQSNGGVTLSGGEPTAQPDFAVNVLRLCKDAGIHTALDTCGYTPFHNLERILEHVDLVLYDFKHINPGKHKKGTGVSNEIILDNARKIFHKIRKPLWARLTIIPGYNDSSENIEATIRFICEELDPSVKVHLLPYHRLGLHKHKKLERDSKESGIKPPEDEDMIKFQKIFESHGIKSIIGG